MATRREGGHGLPKSRYQRLRNFSRAGESFIADSLPYIQHALEQAVEAQRYRVRFRVQSDKVEPTELQSLLANYFQMARKGGHVACSCMAWVSETQFNRLCFICLLKEIFGTWSCQYPDLRLALDDFRCLIRLLCPDYTDSLLRDAVVLAACEQTHLKSREQNVQLCAVPVEVVIRLQELFLCFSTFVEHCRVVHSHIVQHNESNGCQILWPRQR